MRKGVAGKSHKTVISGRLWNYGLSKSNATSVEQVGLCRQFTEVIYFDNICCVDTVVKPNKKCLLETAPWWDLQPQPGKQHWGISCWKLCRKIWWDRLHTGTKGWSEVVTKNWILFNASRPEEKLPCYTKHCFHWGLIINGHSGALKHGTSAEIQWNFRGKGTWTGTIATQEPVWAQEALG